MLKNKFAILAAMVAIGTLSGCAEPIADEDCTRADAMKGALMSGCSAKRVMQLQNEAMLDGAVTVGRGTLAVAKVAAPIAASAATGGAPAAATALTGGNPLVNAAAKAITKEMF